MALGLVLGGLGIAGMVGGARAQRQGVRAQERALTQAAGQYGADIGALGDQELGFTRDMMSRYDDLAGQYRQALRASIQQQGLDRDQAFAGAIDQGREMGQAGIGRVMDGAGVPQPMGTRAYERGLESQARMAPAQELAAILHGEQSMRPYDMQSQMDWGRAQMGMEFDNQQLQQRGMLGRATMDQQGALARMDYQNAMAGAQGVGARRMAGGQLMSGLGQVGLTLGIGGVLNRGGGSGSSGVSQQYHSRY